MPRSRVLYGLGFVFLVTILVIVGTSWWLIQKSFPSGSGSVSVTGLRDRVEIRRDEFGAVHIKARYDRDLYAGIGFVHAQDRLWQMELIRRVGQGKLSEILGKDAVPVDRLFRTLNLIDVARRSEDSLDAETRAVMQAYADGVNEFLRLSGSRLPVEFDILGVTPQPWNIRQSLLVSRLMAWELDYSRWMDVLMGQFILRFGEERARDLFPEWKTGAPTIIRAGQSGKGKIADLRSFLDAEQAARRALGWTSLGHGSNSWVLSGAKTKTRRPILANDPHLLLFTPSRFHEVHLVSPSVEVSGLTIPGVPFVIIGRNRSIAWGLTNAMMDDHDFFVEKADSSVHPTKYLLDGVWQPLNIREDTILVRDQDPILLTTYSTHRGPIINRIESSARWSTELISMRWSGHEVSNDGRTFLLLNRARTWEDFTAALEHFTAPAQNFLYADTAGNIGYHTGGRLPLRPARQALIPADGSQSKNDWRGFITSSGLPSAYNPPEGFIVSANNKTTDERYPHHISHLWEPSWRAERITEVLRDSGRVSVEEMQRLQLDVVSPFARSIVPTIIQAFADTAKFRHLATPLAYLRNWDFTMRPQDPTTTFFESGILRMVEETFEDEMGPELLAVYDTVAGMPLTTLERLFSVPMSPWFNDIRTPEQESRDDIIRRSFTGAAEHLALTMGPDVKQWRWGEVHTVTFAHVFGANQLLAPVFNNGPYSVGGSISTVNVGYYVLTQPFRMNVGPSTRQVYDLSDVNNTRTVLPPGQSGHVFHRNYNDQVSLWLNGAYRVFVMDSALVARAAPDILVLEPAR